MAHKSTFAMRPLGMRKRVLLVGVNLSDAEQRSEFLRSGGYEVDSASCGAAAIDMTRTHSYDLIVVPVDLGNGALEKLCRKLQRMSPNSTIACLADCKKPLPSIAPDRLLWKGEPLEYFLARVDSLSATA